MILYEMKAFFLGKRSRHDLTEEEVHRHRGKAVHFTHDGKEYSFSAEEVDKMLGVCKQCKLYQMRIKALEIQLNTPMMPDKRVLIVDHIQKHYCPSTRRLLSRIALRKKLDGVLMTYGTFVDDTTWSWLIREHLNDTSMYRKLKLACR